MHTQHFRFFLIFVLAMTEIMPVAFLSTAMPVILRRSGASMSDMGFLSLVMIPWALKVLWAPVVDKLGARARFGRYRSWLFLTHPLLLTTLLLGAAVDVPQLLLHNRALGIPALVWLSIVAATADTASHGLAVLLLRPEERGVGNGVQMAGMSVGALVGGGLMIMLVDMFSWRLPLLIMAGCVLLPLGGVALYREPPVAPDQSLDLREAARFFQRRYIVQWLALLALFTMLPSIPGVAFQALFVDHGMSLSEIGMVLGILGGLAGTLGGAVGGLFVRELGRKHAFYVLNILCIVCICGTCFILTRAHPVRLLLYGSVGLVNMGLSMRDTVLLVLLMDRCRTHLASTDYTIQTSAMGLFGFLGSGLGGMLAGHFGANFVFTLVPIVMGAALCAVPRLLPGSEFEQVAQD